MIKLGGELGKSVTILAYLDDMENIWVANMHCKNGLNVIYQKINFAKIIKLLFFVKKKMRK